MQNRCRGKEKLWGHSEFLPLCCCCCKAGVGGERRSCGFPGEGGGQRPVCPPCPHHVPIMSPRRPHQRNPTASPLCVSPWCPSRPHRTSAVFPYRVPITSPPCPHGVPMVCVPMVCVPMVSPSCVSPWCPHGVPKASPSVPMVSPLDPLWGLLRALCPHGVPLVSSNDPMVSPLGSPWGSVSPWCPHGVIQ